MDDKHTWQDAHVGAGTPQLGLRVTEDEKERLDTLRRELRLTSKGQVVRVALDILERFVIAGIALGGPLEKGENWRDSIKLIQKNAGLMQEENARKNAVQAADPAGTDGLLPEGELELP